MGWTIGVGVRGDNESLTDDREDEFEEIRQVLVRVVSRICPTWLSRDRDDIVQEAMVRVMRAADRSGGDPAVSRTYLNKAAYSAMVDIIRKRRRDQERSIDDDSHPVELRASDPDPERGSFSTELGRAIRQCLQALIAPRRRAVTMALTGFGNREIAQLMGWKPKRAENLVSRGRADLRACLDRRGFAP